MSTPRVMPWANWDEWIEVKNSLFSNSYESQIKSIEIIEMWKWRGRIPYSVESTASIVEICSKDHAFHSANAYAGSINQFPKRSDNELRMMYAIVIVRAVNGLVDPGQQSYFAESVLSLATKVGLPAWFVELRHDATHSALPSLAVLREGATCLLTWYLNNYWQPQADHLLALSTQCMPTSTSHAVGNSKTCTSETNTKMDINQLLTRPSVTLVADIFVPMFVQSTLLQDPPVRSSSSALATAFRTAFTKQLRVWESTISHLAINWRFRWMMICHLAAVAISAVERKAQSFQSQDQEQSQDSVCTEEVEVNWRMTLALWWIRLIVKTAAAATSSTSSNNESLTSASMIINTNTNISSPVFILQTLLEKARTYMSLFLPLSVRDVTLLSSLLRQLEKCLARETRYVNESGTCDTPLHHPPLSSGSGSSDDDKDEDPSPLQSPPEIQTEIQKEERAASSIDNISVGLSVKQVNSSRATVPAFRDNISRPITCDNNKMKKRKLHDSRLSDDSPSNKINKAVGLWPLGCVPGEMSVRKLYLIEEVES
eukprot:gene2864-5628_t